MSLAERISTGETLPAYGVMAACLAMAGLPIYLHAPKVFAEAHGVGLAALGSVLFALRLIDVVQDPLLGRLAEALRARRDLAVSGAGAVMALGMVGLFAISPPVAPVLWFALMLTLVFSAYSFLTICFYAQGVTKAETLGPSGHIRLARWRETGAILGVCLASVAPTVLGGLDHPYAVFAMGFALVTLLAIAAMRGEWGGRVAPASNMRAVIGDRIARRLLVVALLNAAPLAVSATLFLYFVESRLAAPNAAGPLLLVFFLSAAAGAALWSRLAETYGTRPILLAAMALSILAFAFVPLLGPGDILPFAVICVVSGLALGADLTLLPALFAARMARVSPSAASGFALWSFVSKFALALAAVVLLPTLQAAGFTPGAADTPAHALTLLALLYGALPCVLKLAAMGLFAATRLEN